MMHYLMYYQTLQFCIVLVLLYCVNAVAVRFILLVVGSIFSIPSSMKPLSITLCSLADVPFTSNKTELAFIAMQLNCTSVPSTASIESG